MRAFGSMLVAIFGLGLVIEATHAEVTGEQLTNAQLKALYPGLVTRTVTHRDNVITNRYKPDGTVEGRTANGSTDSGVWQIEGDRVCTQWKKWEQGKRYCGVLIRFGDQYQLNINGNPRSRFVVAKE